MKQTFRAIVFLIALLACAGVAAAQSGKFTVQLEAAQTIEEAQEKVRQYKAKGVEAYVLKSQVQGKGTFYRVRAGMFPNANEARKFGADLQRRGLVSEFFIAAFEQPKDELVTSTPAPKKTPPVVVKEPAVNPAKDAPKEVAKETPPVKTPPKEVAAVPPNPAPAEAPAPKENRPSEPVKPPVKEPAPKEVAASSKAAPTGAAGFVRFQDSGVGYSFEHPAHWTGGPLKLEEAKAQRVNAGALFTSAEDSAFLNAIWNELDKANSPTNDNDLIVDVILRSMKSGDGTQSMEEVSRQVKNEQGAVKTYLNLRAKFQTQGQNAPLDFLGKAVIVRANKGILLVVAFYAKDGPAAVANTADKIIASVRAPE